MVFKKPFIDKKMCFNQNIIIFTNVFNNFTVADTINMFVYDIFTIMNFIFTFDYINILNKIE